MMMRRSIAAALHLLAFLCHVAESESDPFCLDGLAQGNLCCDKSCGSCDGLDCDSKPGGPRRCCGSRITRRCWSEFGPPPCWHKREKKHLPRPVRGPWKCWVSHYGIYQSWGDRLLGVEQRIDDHCCKGNDPSCFHGKFSRGTCCHSPSVLPQRCSGPHAVNSSVRSPCASLNELGRWFAVCPKDLAGADKHSEYHDFYNFYEERLSRFPQNANLLEIGVSGGNSLAVWGEWFPSGRVVGVDINLDIFEAHWPVLQVLGANRSGNLRALEADGLKPADWAGSQQFDIIIDDAGAKVTGAHTYDLSKGLFEALFPKHLAPGGLYIIEDAWHMHELLKEMTPILEENVQVPSVGSGLNDGERSNVYKRKSSNWKDKIVGIEFRRNLVLIQKMV